MKKRNLLLSICFGMLIGWVLGFLRLPFLEKNYSFWLGFVACLAIVSFIGAVFFLFNKSQPLSQGNSKLKTAVAMAIIIGGLISSIVVFKQNRSYKKETQLLRNKSQEHAIAIQAIKKNNRILLMNGFFDKIRTELKNNANTLSDSTITRIADLSESFIPYQNIGADSLLTNSIVANGLSDERGQLLLELLKLKMDAISFQKIKKQATFANADLRKADLAGVHLDGVDLNHASLWGANLKGANLDGANLNWTDMRWSNLSGATFESANLNAAVLTNAQLVKTKLNDATLQWVELGHTLLNNADFTNCDLLGANLMKVQFSHTDFTDANLERASIEENWLNELSESKIIGAEIIKVKYRIRPDVSRPNKLARFRLTEVKK